MVELAKILVHKTTGHCLIRRQIPARAKETCVSVEFDDPVWDGLVKTVVFRGNGKKIAEFDGETAIVPWEVLENPGPTLWFGIWGSDPDTGLQLPLIEVRIGPIEESTDPDADPGTDPTLPIWAQLKQDVEQLKQSGVGGGGGDWNAAEGQPGHILNRTHWTEGEVSSEILPETALVMSDDGMYINAAFALTAGESYTVHWNGVEYPCVAQGYTEDGAFLIALGDAYTASGGSVGTAATGEPFALVRLPDEAVDGGIYAVVIPLDGSTEATIAIYSVGETVHKLDNKYLALDWLPVLKYEKGAEVISERSGNVLVLGYAWLGQETPYDLTPGNYYYVVWNGNAYHVPLVPGDGETIFGEFTSDAFTITYMYDESEATEIRYGLRCTPKDGSTTVTLSVYEPVSANKIPEDFLPDVIGGIDVTGATVGQIAKISAVDAEGRPTAWEPVDLPDSDKNVAYDEAQNLTDEQKAQARENIGAQPAGNYLTEVPEGYAKTEDIPTDEHINDLINTALGVIENGTY